MKKESVWNKILTIIPEIKSGITNSFIIGIFYEVIRLIPLVIVKLIVDELSKNQSSVIQIAYFVGGVFVAYIILNFVDYYAKRAQFYWMIGYEKSILERAKKKLLQLHVGFHESYNTGMQVSKITKGAQKLSDLMWFTFNEFIPTIVQMVLTVALLIYEQWILAAVFALFMPIVSYITIYSSKKSQPYRRKYHQRHDDAVGELGESLFNISTVKDYVQEKKQFGKFSSLLSSYENYAHKRWNFQEKWWIGRDLLITVGRAGTLGLAAWMVTQGMISTGSLVLVFSLTERAFLSAFRLGRLHSYLEDAMESINRLADLARRKPLITNAKSAKPVRKLKGLVDFRNVTFSYKEEDILKNIKLKIKPKQVVALVGRSGAGKSTMIKLLLRNYDVSRGGIFVDDVNVKDYRIEQYKKRIAVVSQDVEVFNRSVIDNILFANPKATREEVIRAAKRAHAHGFIKEFAKGYDTIIGEKGVRLSGGQKQRLSIARALVANPDIYVFDEATSSLDSESERYIQQSIFSIAGKKTTIIIAHRLSTIRHADVIVVMDKGKIIEQGSYKQLIKKKGHFSKMVKMQKVDGIRE